MQFYLINIRPKLHRRSWRKLRVTLPCYKLLSIVTFTLNTDFLIKIVPSLLNGIKVAAFAWYSVKIRVILGARFERQKVDKKSKPIHENWNIQTLF